MRISLLLTIFMSAFLFAHGQTGFNEEMYYNGKLDANKYYKKSHRAGRTILVISTVTGPVIGLIPTLATASSPPDEAYFAFPDSDLVKNRDYYAGYKSQAAKKKTKKVWINYAVGSVINIVLLTLFINANQP